MKIRNSRHRERSEAIQRLDGHGVLRRSAPRNDGSMQRKLYAVLTRMAQIRNASATCELADCRRARKCVGTERRCVWTLPQAGLKLPRENVSEWRDLLRQRRQCLDAIKAND